MCGENWDLEHAIKRGKGSPPRVRGKHKRDEGSPKVTRITPACAGKTVPDSLSAGLQQDHPRVCGENVEAVANQLVGPGSPPRVRGKRHG